MKVLIPDKAINKIVIYFIFLEKLIKIPEKKLGSIICTNLKNKKMNLELK